MRLNESVTDRMIRIVLGVLLLTGAWMVVGGVSSLVLFTLGAIAFVTGVVGWCPLYAALHLSTRRHAAG